MTKKDDDHKELQDLAQMGEQLERLVDKSQAPMTMIWASIAATIAAPLLVDTGTHSPELSDDEREGARKIARQTLRSAVWLTGELIDALGMNPPERCLELIGDRIAAIEEVLQLQEEKIEGFDHVQDSVESLVHKNGELMAASLDHLEKGVDKLEAGAAKVKELEKGQASHHADTLNWIDNIATVVAGLSGRLESVETTNFLIRKRVDGRVEDHATHFAELENSTADLTVRVVQLELQVSSEIEVRWKKDQELEARLSKLEDCFVELPGIDALENRAQAGQEALEQLENRADGLTSRVASLEGLEPAGEQLERLDDLVTDLQERTGKLGQDQAQSLVNATNEIKSRFEKLETRDETLEHMLTGKSREVDGRFGDLETHIQELEGRVTPNLSDLLDALHVRITNVDEHAAKSRLRIREDFEPIQTLGADVMAQLDETGKSLDALAASLTSATDDRIRIDEKIDSAVVKIVENEDQRVARVVHRIDSSIDKVVGRIDDLERKDFGEARS